MKSHKGNQIELHRPGMLDNRVSKKHQNTRKRKV